MKILSAEQLRDLRCVTCGSSACGHGSLLLLAKCHPRAGTRTAYDPQTHQLVITCNICDAHVITITLGPSGSQGAGNQASTGGA